MMLAVVLAGSGRARRRLIWDAADGGGFDAGGFKSGGFEEPVPELPVLEIDASKMPNIGAHIEYIVEGEFKRASTSM